MPKHQVRSALLQKSPTLKGRNDGRCTRVTVFRAFLTALPLCISCTFCGNSGNSVGEGSALHLSQLVASFPAYLPRWARRMPSVSYPPLPCTSRS